MMRLRDTDTPVLCCLCVEDGVEIKSRYLFRDIPGIHEDPESPVTLCADHTQAILKIREERTFEAVQKAEGELAVLKSHWQKALKEMLKFTNEENPLDPAAAYGGGNNG